MTEISTRFHYKPKNCLILDKMSVGKRGKWGMAKIRPATLLTIAGSQHGRMWRSLFTTLPQLFYLRPQNWIANTPSEVSEPETHWLFWWPLQAYCVLNLSPSTHCCAVTCHKQMALCLYHTLDYILPKTKTIPPALRKPVCVLDCPRSYSRAASHSWAILMKPSFRFSARLALTLLEDGNAMKTRRLI